MKTCNWYLCLYKKRIFKKCGLYNSVIYFCIDLKLLLMLIENCIYFILYNDLGTDKTKLFNKFLKKGPKVKWNSLLAKIIIIGHHFVF
jgi:hypothetical protein